MQETYVRTRLSKMGEGIGSEQTVNEYSSGGMLGEKEYQCVEVALLFVLTVIGHGSRFV